MRLILSISHKSSTRINFVVFWSMDAWMAIFSKLNHQGFKTISNLIPTIPNYFWILIAGEIIFLAQTNPVHINLFLSVTSRSTWLATCTQNFRFHADIKWQKIKKIKEQIKNRSEYRKNDERSKVNLDAQMVLSASDIQ